VIAGPPSIPPKQDRLMSKSRSFHDKTNLKSAGSRTPKGTGELSSAVVVALSIPTIVALVGL